jgi:protein-S-isoprenylcysteine O-methyltransferase Ste14
MKNVKDNPGVFIPPPLFYVIIFLLSFILQGYFTIRSAFFFHSMIASIIGIIIFIAALMIFAVPAVRQFIKSRNTLIPFKPATSLQTNGIYSVSRNPMYTGLLFQYLGLALIFGNWWTLILFPVLIVLVQYLIILPEERYLMRAFGNSYSDYKNKVRRWI